MSACYCDQDPPEFVNKTDRVSRKLRTCCECNKQIQPGELYRNVSGKWDGYFLTFHQCEKCGDLWDSLVELGYCLYFERLLETHREIIGERTARQLQLMRDVLRFVPAEHQREAGEC